MIKRIKEGLFFFFIFCLVIDGYGQNSSCLNKAQLLRLHATSAPEGENFLLKANWISGSNSVNETEFYFGYELEYLTRSFTNTNYGFSRLFFYEYKSMPRMLILNTNKECFESLRLEFANDLSLDNSQNGIAVKDYQQGKLTVSFRQYFNNYDKQFSILVYNTKVVNYEIENMKEEIALEKEAEEKRLIQERAQEELKQIEISRLISESNSLKQAYEFDGALMKLQEAFQLEASATIQELISTCQNEQCMHLISLADDLYNHGEYQSAISSYEGITGCQDYFNQIQNKIKDSRNRIKEDRINALTRDADQFYKSKSYGKALELYNSILELDSRNYNAVNKKKEINDLFAFLNLRKTKIYDYSSTNSSEYRGVRNELGDFLNSSVSKSSQGFLNFQYTIAFDTSGVNRSSYNLIKSNVSEANGFLNGFTGTHSFGPTKDKGYYVNSASTVSFDCSWATTQIKVRSRKNQLNYKHSDFESSEINKFVQSPNTKFGLFTFDVKTKTLNGTTYSDILLTNYKTKAGPGNVFLSMLLPGAGTLKVTHGEKGLGRMVWFILFTGTSAFLDNASNYHYDLYLTSSNQQTIQDNYKIANGYHHASLIFGSIAASIYIYDIFEVFGRGIKNEHNAKQLKSSHRYPIKVKEDTFSVN